MSRWLVIALILLAVSGCGEYDSENRNQRHETCNRMGGNYTERDGTWICTNRVK